MSRITSPDVNIRYGDLIASVRDAVNRSRDRRAHQHGLYRVVVRFIGLASEAKRYILLLMSL
jgi:hypothetical protein